MKVFKKISVLLVIISVILCFSGCNDETHTGNATEIESNDEISGVGVGNSSVSFSTVDLTVIIDPGHGFDDPGSQPEFMTSPEADVTLKSANILKRKLEEKGINVILTHDGKTYPDEKMIKSEANKYKVSYDDEKIVENNVFSAYESKRVGECFG